MALDTPDVTPGAKGGAIATAATALAIILAAPERLQVVLIIVAGACYAAYLGHDAWIRGRRAEVSAAVTTANFSAELAHADGEMPHSGPTIGTDPIPVGAAPIIPEEPSQPKRRRASQA